MYEVSAHNSRHRDYYFTNIRFLVFDIFVNKKLLEKPHVCVEITKVKSEEFDPAYNQPKKIMYLPVCSSYWLRN